MGRQVNFRILPADLAELEEVLRKRGGVFIPYYHHSPRLTTCATLGHDETTDPKLWSTPADIVPQVRLRYISEQGYWLVDQMQSPVMEVAKGGRFDGTKAPRGRLYFKTDFLDRAAFELVKLPPEFIEWGQGVLSWMRRRYRRDKETWEYWGPHAQAWREATAG